VISTIFFLVCKFSTHCIMFLIQLHRLSSSIYQNFVFLLTKIVNVISFLILDVSSLNELILSVETHSILERE